MEKKPLLEIEDLSVGYGKRTVVSGLDFSVDKGEILSVIGPNGTGKSTILKTLSFELKPVKGHIILDGKDLASYDRKERATRLAVVLTGGRGAELMTCREAVETARYPYTDAFNRFSEKDRKAVDEALELSGAAPHADKMIREVSDGERQRVLLACAIAQEPELIILDEPTSFLDIKGRYEFLKVLEDLCRGKNMAAVMSIHELDLAKRISDKVLCIKNGKGTLYESPQDVFSKESISGLFDVDISLL